MSIQPEDLEEFVREGIGPDEELLWFSRPRFQNFWRHEIGTALTKRFLWVFGGLLLANALAFAFGCHDKILLLMLVPALGGLVFRLCWIWYLGRRLTYVIASARLLFLLEAARPIDFKSYPLEDIGNLERSEKNNGWNDINLIDLEESLFGVVELEKVEQLLSSKA